ncbi:MULTISPECIES: GxxExxY protein [Labilibaculum]|uniref:GxxExxY protein n=1 Tax=Labilibaculum euxinus TaxID=2686357 RepID=A0A7M4D7V5_9BACT|nr:MULTISPECIES: GxxExxY protein [Labilibaculum]MDM8159222.1 GxxExxY protein [Labilibaculum sp. K2S]MUP38734.1 GxxExxY protein [Labilibaculum euxinus]MVB07939.1 GxxExxY protein [Labilibaculum euxinus]
MISKTEFEEIGRKIVQASYEVHKELGPGLLESVYEICLVEELKNLNLKVERQVELPVNFKGKVLDKKFVIDLLVENCIIIELKAVEVLLPVHEVQLVTYMKLADIKLGYLVNFNVPLIKQGIKRKVNNYFL